MSRDKVITADAAAELVLAGDTLATTGFVGPASPRSSPSPWNGGSWTAGNPRPHPGHLPEPKSCQLLDAGIRHEATCGSWRTRPSLEDALTGSLACLVGVGVLAASSLTAPGQVLLPLVVLGLGIVLATPAAQSASLGAVDRRDSGMAAGVNSTMRYLGGVVGVAILGRSLDLSGDRAHILGEHRSGLRTDAVGRLLTDETLTSIDDPRVVAAGDAAAPSGEPWTLRWLAATTPAYPR